VMSTMLLFSKLAIAATWISGTTHLMTKILTQLGFLEDDNKSPETCIADWVANHIATVSTDGMDDDPFGSMDVPALVAE